MFCYKYHSFFASVSFALLLIISACSNNNKNEQLIDDSKSKILFSSKIICLSDSAYSYEILKNGNIYIRQSNIPAIPGNKKFKTDIQAKKVADLVISKLKLNIVPPTILISEIDSLKIFY